MEAMILESNELLGLKKSGHMARIIGQSIVAGFYDAKPFPNESEVGEQFGTSRTVVRESLKILEAKGLILSKPKSGVQVLGIEHWKLLDPQICNWLLKRPFSKSLCIDFTQMRLAVEPFAATLAAEKAEPAGIALIESQVAEMRRYSDNPTKLLEADVEFHIAILRASANDAFWRLRGMVKAALHMSIQVSQFFIGIDIDMHEDLYKAIAEGRSGDAGEKAALLITTALDLIKSYNDTKQPDRA